jgi:hypothetical protein
MNTTSPPLPDRWLVLPSALYEILKREAPAHGLLALRLETLQIEPVEVETLPVRAKQLLADGWAHVRLVVGELPASESEQLFQALDCLAGELVPTDAARMRLHDHVQDPRGTAASLSAPDEAVLRHWLAQNQPELPRVLAPNAAAGWIDRYLQAFDEWRAAVEQVHGACAFDWFRVEPAQTVEQSPRVAFHDFAVNDEHFPLVAGGRFRGDSEDAASPPPIGAWADTVGGVRLRFEAREGAEPGAPVTMTLQADPNGAPGRLTLRALEVLGPDDAVLAQAELRWTPGLPVAQMQLDNTGNLLRRKIRRGEVRLRLHYERSGQPPHDD